MSGGTRTVRGVRTLSRRHLNRATLARQLLLGRAERTAADAIGHLVGVQAQAPLAPYVSLWSRLVDFRPAELADLLTTGQAVRTTLMRATIHLVVAPDARPLHALLRPMLERRFATSPYARHLDGLDLTEVRRRALELLEREALTRPRLSEGLRQWWPDRDPASLAYAVTFAEPLVHMPPRGVWGRTGPVSYRPTGGWLSDSTQDTPQSLDEMVLRYLGAFGPASVRDVQTWSGLTRLGEVVTRLRPGLVAFRDEGGVELFDLPDAPRPDPETPSPPRFLAEYDNVLLSHADRARVNPAGHQVPLLPGNGANAGTFLLDGDFRGTWGLDRAEATLRIRPFSQVTRAEKTALSGEAEGLMTFLTEGKGTIEVRTQ